MSVLPIRLASLGPGVVLNASDVVPGRAVYVYLRGTTTPADVYQDSGLTIPLNGGAQPITTDVRGRIPGYVASSPDLDMVDTVTGDRIELEMLTGAPGTDGATGPPGITATILGDWNSGRTYTDGPPPDAVFGSDGALYVSLTSGNLNHNPVGDGGVNWASTLPPSVESVSAAFAANELLLTSQLAADDGVASLDSGGNVPLDQLGNVPSPGAGALTFPAGLIVPGPYNATEHVYNLGSFAKTRAALSAALAGTGHAHILCIGDSITAGSYSIGQTPAIQPATDAYPVKLREALATLGFTICGDGFIAANYGNTDTQDSRIVYVSGTWNNDYTGIFTQSASNAAEMTCTTELPSTSVVIYYVDLPSPNIAQYKIDGGAAVNLPSTGTFNAEALTLTGLSNTTHTIEIISPSGGNVCQIIGFDGGGALPGVKVSNGGLSGTTAADWATVTNANYPLVDLAAIVPEPTTVLLMLGTNDVLQSEGATTYGGYLATIATWVATNFSTADFAFMLPPAPDPSYGSPPVTDTLWASYMQQVIAQAGIAGVPALNISEVLGPWATANAAGTMGPDVHPTALGYADIAAAVAAMLT
jgi:lysophospholipase L1-like esterase